MWHDFHFIRPYWLLMLVPLLGFAWHVLHKNPGVYAWRNVCDSHLLPYLVQTKPQLKRHFSLLLLLTSALCMIIALSGPAWSRFPVPTYRPLQPRVILLHLSESMLENDLQPNRLTRAKFKLHDLFKQREMGQFGMVVYTGEPFVVSPLTDDGQTIESLLATLAPEIMPVTGDNLADALIQGQALITEAGFQQGSLLVMTPHTPSREAIEKAAQLYNQGFSTSVMPIQNSKTALNPRFEDLAKAGGGEVISFADDNQDLQHWLQATQHNMQYGAQSNNEIPVWRDQGRWFIIPALLCLLPVFRRGWIQRVLS